MTNFLKKIKFVAGIDYSLTSPAVCVAKIIDNEIKFENCKFHFLKQNKSHKSLGKIFAYDYPEYTDDIDRFSKLASWTVECIRWFDGRVDKVYLEDYAFAATGRVFNIGENTGILKKQLKEAGLTKLLISSYDGPEESKALEEVLLKADFLFKINFLIFSEFILPPGSRIFI